MLWIIKTNLENMELIQERPTLFLRRALDKKDKTLEI